MSQLTPSAWRILAVLLIVPLLALSQTAPQNLTLTVSGQPGQAPVIQINSKFFVDLDALARITSGTLGFQGNQITLTLPGSAASTPAAPPSSAPPASAFSKEFLRAGIEEMTVIREWRSALMNAIQNGYPVTDAWMAKYQGQASTNLRLASVAVNTAADQSAFQLLSNEFDKMKKLSNKVLAARQNMSYVSPDAVKNDPLDQQILGCARSLAAMAASGQFQDDGSCD